MQPGRRDEQEKAIRLDLNRAELALIRTALELLEDTLGHEEAGELSEVQALLRRIAAASGGSR